MQLSKEEFINYWSGRFETEFHSSFHKLLLGIEKAYDVKLISLVHSQAEEFDAGTDRVIAHYKYLAENAEDPETRLLGSVLYAGALESPYGLKKLLLKSFLTIVFLSLTKQEN